LRLLLSSQGRERAADTLARTNNAYCGSQE